MDVTACSTHVPAKSGKPEPDEPPATLECAMAIAASLGFVRHRRAAAADAMPALRLRRLPAVRPCGRAAARDQSRARRAATPSSPRSPRSPAPRRAARSHVRRACAARRRADRRGPVHRLHAVHRRVSGRCDRRRGQAHAHGAAGAVHRLRAVPPALPCRLHRRWSPPDARGAPKTRAAARERYSAEARLAARPDEAPRGARRRAGSRRRPRARRQRSVAAALARSAARARAASTARGIEADLMRPPRVLRVLLARLARGGRGAAAPRLARAVLGPARRAMGFPRRRRMSEQRFRAALALWPADDPQALIVETQIARAQGLRRQFADAHATLDAVATRLDGVPSHVRVRYLLERGRVVQLGGGAARAPSRSSRKRSRLPNATDDAFYAVDAAHMLGIAAPAPAQLDWNLKALAMTRCAPTDARARGWRASLYNNIGLDLPRPRRFATALAYFRQGAAGVRARGDAVASAIARWTIARGAALARPARRSRGDPARARRRVRARRASPTATCTRSWPRSRSRGATPRRRSPGRRRPMPRSRRRSGFAADEPRGSPGSRAIARGQRSRPNR